MKGEVLGLCHGPPPHLPPLVTRPYSVTPRSYVAKISATGRMKPGTMSSPVNSSETFQTTL